MMLQYILSWEIGSNLCQQEFEHKDRAEEAFQLLVEDFRDKKMNVPVYLERITKDLVNYWDADNDN